MMVADNPLELTEDEAELYDRQIRLWGLESQKRIRSSRILIIGLKGLGAEVAKNIILAGVKTVTLLDDGVVTEEDICSNFLIRHGSVGSFRAACSHVKAQELNPMVKVKSDVSKVLDKPDDFFLQFDVIVATECTVSDLKRINTICRSKNVKFFCGDVYGLFGYLFADLLVHSFAEDIVKLPSEKVGDKKKSEPVKITVKQTVNFVPLSKALSVDWSKSENAKKVAKMDCSYFLMRVLMEFRSKYNRKPDPKERENDIELLKGLSKSVLNSLNVSEDKIPDCIFSNVFSEVSPVCAIVGGVLAQEVLKAVSQKESPHNNFFFFNPETNCGFVETHGSSD